VLLETPAARDPAPLPAWPPGGTHFGGSPYSMCDPFFKLILRQKLGPGYTFTDKRASDLLPPPWVVEKLLHVRLVKPPEAG
jgi:hypothetical protein